MTIQETPLDFELFEDSGGHALVLLHGPSAGLVTYCCDRCSSVLFAVSGRVVGFSSSSGSTLLACSSPASPGMGLKEIIRSIDAYLAPYVDDGEEQRRLSCARCDKELSYLGEPHPDGECAVREVTET